jgi:hypothetical protein
MTIVLKAICVFIVFIFVKLVAPFFDMPSNKSLTIVEGENTRIECVLMYGQDSEITFEWRKDNVTISSPETSEKYAIDEIGSISSKLTIIYV